MAKSKEYAYYVKGGKLAVVQLPITPLPSSVTHAEGTSIESAVTFLSPKSSFIGLCVIPPGNPSPSPAPGELSPSTGT